MRSFVCLAKFVPSPMEEENLPAPKIAKIVQHSADEIGRLLHQEENDVTIPQFTQAQHAFHRPFVPDPVEEGEFAAPLRHSTSYHSVNEITQAQAVKYSTVETPNLKLAEVMFTRPGFDNVPSY